MIRQWLRERRIWRSWAQQLRVQTHWWQSNTGIIHAVAAAMIGRPIIKSQRQLLDFKHDPKGW